MDKFQPALPVPEGVPNGHVGAPKVSDPATGMEVDEAPVSTWLLPPPSWKPKGKPYPSTFKMTEADAKARGAIAIVPGTTETRRSLGLVSAGRDGVKSTPAGRQGPSGVLQEREPRTAEA